MKNILWKQRGKADFENQEKVKNTLQCKIIPLNKLCLADFVDTMYWNDIYKTEFVFLVTFFQLLKYDKVYVCNTFTQRKEDRTSMFPMVKKLRIFWYSFGSLPCKPSFSSSAGYFLK